MRRLLFAAAAATMLLPPLYARIDLAADGQTDYIIVWPAQTTFEERAAARDLCWHLNKITGAKFKTGRAGKKSIFVGVKAPSDNQPLDRYERRIRNENGNIYLYGNGKQGNAFAVYDFLEHFFGCRWYSFFGDARIPERRTVSFDEQELHKNIIPSFNSFSYRGNIYTQKNPTAGAFRRRSRIYDNRSADCSSVPMLTTGHVPTMFIPPGYVKPGAHKPVAGPIKYFADKKYFETDPEFYAKDWNGKRTWQYQLCYSNRELRKELLKNYQIFIDREYKGGEAIIHFDLNDKGKYGMPVCYCKECAKLNEKFGNPAGAFYDALIEVAGHFMPKYPQIHFHLTAYQLTREVPSKFQGKFPRNVMIRIAALDETDFLKPYKDTPATVKMFDSWAKASGGDHGVQFYPTVYPRPLFTRPLVANINRVVQNMYYIHDLGFADIDCEFGESPISTAGFNELRVFILARLANNIKADVKADITDFMYNYYGEKAAPVMLKYYYELEECEKNEKRFMRWWPDHRSCLTYLTPENLLRWQGYFDEMLKVTAAGSRHHLNIRRARQNLDEATLSVWYKFAPGQMPDRDMILKRHLATADDDTRDVMKKLPDRKLARHYYQASVKRYNWRPIYYHHALAGKWNPLPEQFAAIPKEDILRAVPYINRGVLTADPEAATGITAASSRIPDEFTFFSARWEKTNVEKRQKLQETIKLADIKAKQGYNFYYIGTTRLYSDMNIYSNMIYGGGVALGYLYDEKDPEQLYDVYFSVKYDPEKKMLMNDQVLLIKSRKETQKLKDDNTRRISDPGQFA